MSLLKVCEPSSNTVAETYLLHILMHTHRNILKFPTHIHVFDFFDIYGIDVILDRHIIMTRQLDDGEK